MRPPAPEDRDAFKAGSAEGFERAAHNVAAFELGGGFRKYPRDVECHVPHADNHGRLAGKIDIQVGKLGVAIIPSDKCCTAEHVGEIAAFNTELAIVGRPG